MNAPFLPDYKQLTIRTFAILLAVTLLLPACTSPAAAAQPALPASVSATGEAAPATLPVATLGDPQELEDFIDTEMARQMENLHIAGAEVAIVQGNRVLLSKGYGYANREQKIPVDASRTLFRIGSVTKLFTWTAVMQLVEQGKIDLNADVNTYLKTFQIPATYPQPVTMLDLMSHTAGFEELSIPNGTIDPAEIISLGTFLANAMPGRAFPPGEITAYSNYGVALAGYIVEQVSGEPYDQYVAEHILKPLGMKRSSASEPIPQTLAADLSKSYAYQGVYQEVPYMLLYVAPAGSLNATADDMAKFMLAHLNAGAAVDNALNEVSILQPETARRMQTQSYTFDPALDGIAHGFFEATDNGYHLIGHDGDISGYHTELRLIPEEQVGIYVTYNTAMPEADRSALVDAFMDCYFPEQDGAKLEALPAGSHSNLNRYAGYYTHSRHNYSSANRFFVLMEMMLVRQGPGNNLLFPGMLIQMLSPYPQESWVEIQPGVFQNTRTDDRMVFKEDENGQVRYMALSSQPYWVYVRQPWHARQDIYLGILIFSPLIFVLTLVVAPLGWIIGLFKRGSRAAAAWPTRLARGIALALCLAFAAFLAFFSQMPGDLNQPTVMILSWSIAALALGVTALAVAAWRKGWWNRAGRLHYTFVALAGLAAAWLMAYWGLMGI